MSLLAHLCHSTGAQPKSSAALLARIRARTDSSSGAAGGGEASGSHGNDSGRLSAEDKSGLDLAQQVQQFLKGQGNKASTDAVLLKFGPVVKQGEQKVLFRELLKEMCDTAKVRDARSGVIRMWILKERYRTHRLR